MELSDRGLRMLCALEGFVDHVYHGARDRPDVLTVGYGHVLSAEEKAAGTYAGGITKDEALALCKRDVMRIGAPALKLVRVPLTQGQTDAIILLSFNIGEDAFARSTLLGRLNAGDYLGAAAEFLRWDVASGKHDPGLHGRREAEARLFLEGMPAVGGPTLDDVLRLAEAQQLPVAGLVDWEGRATRPTDPAPPDPIREADTNPELALPPKRETES